MDYTIELAQFKVIQKTDYIQQEGSIGKEIPAGVAKIKAPEFWVQGNYGQGVKIAILDTGCDVNHPDLKDNIIGGWNFTADDGGNTSIYQDYNGHGTHVAGTIAAKLEGQGVVGVAPQAQLLILKVLDKEGRGSYEWLINAIHYSIQQGVDIISMSLGGPLDIPELHQAVREAVDKNILVVCAAANSGDGNVETNEYAFPGYYPEVISVGAADIGGHLARFSNTNDQIDLVAPGVDILSTYINGGYATLSGTSMAAPHVTGALALIMNWGKQAYGRPLSELECYTQLMKRTISIGLPKGGEGNGILYLTMLEVLEGLKGSFV